MKEANDSGFDSHEYFGALFEEEKGDGDIFFELDSILQCVGDFHYEEKAQPSGGYQHAAPHLPDVAVGRRADVKPGRDDESLLRDDELRWTETVAMLDTRSCYASELNTTEASASYSLSPASHGSSLPASESVRTATRKPDTAHADSPANSEAPKPKNQNRSRKRQREEIERLRTSVEEMQLQLQTLLSGSDQPCNLSQTQIQSYLHENLAWKRAASIDKEQAERGAIESLKLRALIHEHGLICKSLSEICSRFRVLNSQVSSRAVMEIGVIYANYCRAWFAFKQDVGPGFTYVDMEKPAVLPDSATFDTLHQGLDAQYQQLSTIWDECNFTNVRVETKVRNQIRSDGDGQRYFECTKGHIFSFSAIAVSQTIWQLTKGGLLTPNNGELKVRAAFGLAGVTD